MTAYRFDDWGWYDGEVPDGSPRSTPTAPTNTSTATTPGALRSNWTGHAWIELAYVDRTPIELAGMKARLIGEIRARRLAAESSGITVGQHLVPTTPDVRQQLRELKDWSDDNTGLDVPVERADGSIVTITRTQLAAVVRAVVAHIRNCVEVERTKRAEVELLTTKAAAAAYDVNAGWPS